LYLLFNEGYSASYGDNLIRPDLCNEGIRLTILLVEHSLTDKPQAHALLALMLFNASRLPARLDKQGNLLLLKQQDRTLWDRSMIRKALFHLHKSANTNEITEYHLQAAISACHSLTEDYKSTDWKQILSLYDMYLKMNSSPLIALNRAIAFSRVYGPKAGIDAIHKINNLRPLKSYHLLYSTLADLQMQLNEYNESLINYQKALRLAKVKSEQSFYKNKIKMCLQRMGIAKRHKLGRSF
jgi:RNA polymerase sigma-70 factor (ECF subfamily)